MLVLLPPSETKRAGGSGRPWELSRLALPELRAQREAVLTALEELSTDAAEAARVLKLGATQLGEIEVNAVVRSAAGMPAVDRYTGVLYDALGAASLDGHARRWLGRRVLIHSAPLGPVGALDPIPQYRLGASASLPGLAPLRRLWADAVTRAIEAASPAFVVDLRSEAYVALGPVPERVPSVFVRVVTEGPDGAVRALNHFNKHAKGAFVRSLAQSRPRVGTLGALRRWALDAGWTLRDGAPGEWHLVTESVTRA
ncbi:MAG: peroxide stress protein YaaA [Microbacterium sp.]|uniref:YaaA family protein n=1 Tax=Microbacterium sp. TaxID=51671 RepID=UPI0039E5F30A